MTEEICHKPLILKDEWRKEVDVGKGRAKAEAARAGFLIGFGVNVIWSGRWDQPARATMLDRIMFSNGKNVIWQSTYFQKIGLKAIDSAAPV